MTSLGLGKTFSPLLARPKFGDAEPVAAVVTHLIDYYGKWLPSL